MLRLALTIYLTLATFAGQWLCCCSAHRLSELIGQSPKGTAETARLGSNLCCGHHRVGATHDGVSKPGARSPAQPDHPTCPCQEHRLGQVAGLGSDSEAAKHLRTAQALAKLFDVFAFTGQFVSLGVSNLPYTDPAGVPCLMTVRDLLSTLQTLRC